MIRTLPGLSELVAVADLPPALGPVADALVPLLDGFRYDDLWWASTPSGDAGRVELTVVSWERLGLAIGGADGVALVLQPDQLHGQTSEVRLVVDWRWPVLAVADRLRTDTLPTTIDEWFSLFATVFSIDPRELLADAIDTFFDPTDDGLAEFVASYNAVMGASLSLPGATDPNDAAGATDPTNSIFTQLAAIDNDVGALLVDHLVTQTESDPARQLVRLVELVERWLGTFDPAEVAAFFLPDVTVAVQRVAAAIEVPRTWLVPVNPDGTEVPLPARAQLRAEAGRLSFSTTEGVRLDAGTGFHLDRASILGTGLTVEVQGALPALGVGPPPPAAVADGRPDDFVGLVVDEAAVGFPVGFVTDDASTVELFASDLVLGTGGVSGVIGLRGRSGMEGEPPGPLHVAIGGDSGVGLLFDHVDLAIEQNVLVRSTFAGGMTIPGLAGADGTSTTLAMSASVDADGRFVIETTGEVFLGDGLTLGPGGPGPVLRAEITDGTSDTASFSVDGELRVPCGDAPGCVRSVRVVGAISVTRAANGDWSIDEATMASEATGLAWALPGGLVLQDFGAGISWSDDGGFMAEVHGSVDTDGGMIAVGGRLTMPDPTDPADVIIDGAVAMAHVDLGIVHVIDGAAVLHAATRPSPSGSVRVIGTVGLLPDDTTPSQPTVDDFDLAVADLDAALMVGADGASLVVAGGSILLPDALSPGPPPGAPPGASVPRPSASVAPDDAIVLHLGSADGSLAASIGGSVVVSGLGVDVDGVVHAVLTSARLTFSSTALPRLTSVHGSLTVPLTEADTLELALIDAEFSLDGLPVGTIALGQTVDIDLGGGFLLRVEGGTDATGPGGLATGITVISDNGAHIVRIDASLAVVFPAAALALGDGSSLLVGGAGNVIVAPTEALVHIESAVVGGTFRLGGPSGLLVEDALVTATGLANILDPSPTAPVTLDVTGMVVLPDGGPGFGMRGARFVLDGGDLPRFDIEGFDIAPGEVLSAGDVVPVQLHEAGLTFREQLPFPERLAPTNLEIALSGSVMLPLGDGDGIGGQVDDLTITFDADGIPQMSIDGIGLEIAGVELGVLEIGGQIYIGGLSGLSDPSQLFFTGRVGGTLSGAGVKVLAAFRLTGPIGGCIDVSLGPAGIPLGQTGILLTGIAGGVSFSNQGGDPCDFRSYVQLGDDGRPVAAPDPDAAAAPESASDPHADPPGGPATMPAEDELAFPVPAADCPPASMNILAQPHPNVAQYPDAVIYKFSAIDEPTLNDLGITRELVESWGLTTPSGMAAAFASAMRTGIAGLWPPMPEGLDAVAEAAEAALDAVELFVAAVAEQAFDAVLDAAGGADDVYDAVVDIAWAGVPVADVTVKLTGTFSYVGVSAFLSITGGFVLSTTGAAGIVGSLNLLGIPVGTFRGFATATDAQGLPNPALCGEVKAAVGPLSLGTLRMSMSCPGGVTGMAQAIVDAGSDFSAGVIRSAIRHAAPRVRELPAYDDSDPHAALALLTPEEAVALIGHIVSDPPSDVDAYRDALVGLLDDLWDAFQPEILLAGSVQPKLFGLPLAGELVGVSAYATKTELAGQFRFSPSYIISYFLGGVLPGIDQATLGFRVALPDPADALRSGMTGAFADTAALVETMEQGLEHVLANATFTISYSIAPLGLELADAQARLILPELDDHPDTRAGGWQPPEDRPRRNFPSRSDILAAAMTADMLGNPLWTGSEDQLAALDVGDADPPVGLDLRRDYFPHGGFVGAGYLALPRLLVEPPPVELIGVLFDGGAPLIERATALVELVADWILTTVDVGSLAFAMPCPSLPAIGGNLRDAVTAAARLELPDDPAAVFPVEHAFFRGTVDGRILGIPVGRADVEAVGADAASGRPGQLRISASVPSDSWLSGFIGQLAIEFVVTGTPDQPVAERFAAFLKPSAATRASPPRLADLGPRPTIGYTTLDLASRHAGFRRATGGSFGDVAATRGRTPAVSAVTESPREGSTRRRRAVRSMVDDATRRVLEDRGAEMSRELPATSRTRVVPNARNADGRRQTPDALPADSAPDVARGLPSDRAHVDVPATDRSPSDRDLSGRERHDVPTSDGLPAGRKRPTDPDRPGRDRPDNRGDSGSRPPTPLGDDVAEVLAALATDFPKVSLHVVVDDLAIPDDLAFLLGVDGSASAELRAYSIAFDPDHQGDRPSDRVRRNGGVVLEASFQLAASFGLEVDVDRVEIVVDAGGTLFPTLSAAVDGVDVELPGGLPAMEDVDVDLVVPGGNAGWQTAAATFRADGRVFGRALTLSLQSVGGVRKLSGSADVDVGFDATIGPLRAPVTNQIVVDSMHIDATLGADLSFSIRPTSATVTASGQFGWAGSTWTLLPTTLTGSIVDVPSLATSIGNAIAAQATTIFAGLVGSPQGWIDGLRDGLFSFGGSVVDVLHDAYEVAADVAADLLEGLGWSVGQIANALDDVWSAPVSSIIDILGDIGAGAGEIAAALRHQLGQTRNAVAIALANAGYSWSVIADALGEAFTLSAAQLANSLQTAGAAWDDAAAALDDFGSLSADSFADAMEGAGYTADEVGNALSDYVTSSALTAASGLENAGFDSTSVANAIRDHFTTNITTAGNALVAAGYGASTVARLLTDVFKATAAQVGSFLMSAFELTATQLNAALEAASFGVSEIGAVVASFFSF